MLSNSCLRWCASNASRMRESIRKFNWMSFGVGAGGRPRLRSGRRAMLCKVPRLSFFEKRKSSRSLEPITRSVAGYGAAVRVGLSETVVTYERELRGSQRRRNGKQSNRIACTVKTDWRKGCGRGRAGRIF